MRTLLESLGALCPTDFRRVPTVTRGVLGAYLAASLTMMALPSVLPAQSTSCEVNVFDGDREVEIAELVRAVNNLLDESGCAGPTGFIVPGAALSEKLIAAKTDTWESGCRNDRVSS